MMQEACSKPMHENPEWLAGSDRQTIAKGSKSFYLASLFFSARDREHCWQLYRWCRYCDDQIDNATNDREAEAALTRIQLQTTEACRSLTFDLTCGQFSGPVFSALQRLFEKVAMPSGLPLDLIEGFAMDVRKTKYQSIAEVENYGYHVAGVVGVMMSRVMGVRDARANAHAVALGTAMQLTNIARDVLDDHERGRLYLPVQWLHEEGVDAATACLPENRRQLFRVVERLLSRADDLYAQGNQGFKYLPLRARIAVSIAASIYRRIGTKLLRSGPGGLERRTTVPLREKIILVGHGLITALRARPPHDRQATPAPGVDQ